MSTAGEGRIPPSRTLFDGEIKPALPRSCQGNSTLHEQLSLRRDLRVVFIGVDHAVTARHLTIVAAAHSVVAIFETTAARGWRLFRLRLRPTRLRRFAHRHAIPYRLVDSGQRRELSRFLAGYKPDVVCVVFMPYLLPPEALAVPTLGVINLHPSLLPAYRGAEPYFWQIYDGVEESGVTAHLADEREDHGPILAQREFPLPSGITYEALESLVSEHGPPALLEAIERLATDGSLSLAPQLEESPTRRARRISRQEARELIDWSGWRIERVWRVLRGAGPLLSLPPMRWRDLGYRPRTEGYERIPAPGPPGSLQRDAAGWYLAHPEGRIRISYAFAPREWRREVLPLGRLIFPLVWLKRQLTATCKQLVRNAIAARR